jgi:hypothetical protein
MRCFRLLSSCKVPEEDISRINTENRQRCGTFMHAEFAKRRDYVPNAATLEANALPLKRVFELCYLAQIYTCLKVTRER